MTLHPPRSRFWRLSIYFVCLLLVLLALDMLWAHARRTIHPGYATTRIVEPRLDDGTVDYLTAIETYFSRGVTADNNAFPLLLEALGREALPKTQPPDGITGRLGMRHLPEKGDYLVMISDFTKSRAAHSASTQPDDVAQPDEYEFPKPPSPATVAWLENCQNDQPMPPQLPPGTSGELAVVQCATHNGVPSSAGTPLSESEFFQKFGDV